MRRFLQSLILLSALTFAVPASCEFAVQLTVDASEAKQVLSILEKLERGAAVTDADWRELFATEPYRWLKEREASIGASFEDEQFKAFVKSDEARRRRPEWERTLAQLLRSDPRSIGAQVLEWLPAGARIHARVYLEIKPRGNSFVWRKEGEGPAIFLALGTQTRDQFENTLAHECHHIGLQSLEAQQTALRAKLPPRVASAIEWMSAFGEGEAMLAAAGSVQKHPQWEDDALARARWDADMMRFDADVEQLEHFFTDILDGAVEGEDAIQKRAAPFWGDAQGAWYTVGYEMSVLVEQRYGRQAFLDCLIDPRKLLAYYNQIAEQAAKKGAVLRQWSPELLSRLAVE